jgi:hypothetical protein
MSATDLDDAHDAYSSQSSHTLWSLFPFRSPAADSEEETDSDVPAAESRNDLNIDPAELQVRASPFYHLEQY